MARGSVRRSDALLAGLLRCGHCGRRLHVSYSGTVGYCVRYHCRGAHLNHGVWRVAGRCGRLGGTAAGARALGIEAALHAIDARAADNSEVHRQAELALTQARYEAGLARRQYEAVDLTTAWSPPSWSGAGTIGSSRFTASRNSSRRWRRQR